MASQGGGQNHDSRDLSELRRGAPKKAADRKSDSQLFSTTRSPPFTLHAFFAPAPDPCPSFDHGDHLLLRNAAELDSGQDRDAHFGN